MVSLLNGGRTVVAEDEEKAELLNTFFASVTTDKTSPLGSLTPESKVKECWSEDYPLGQKDRVREHLDKLDICPWLLTRCIHECCKSW